MARSNLGVKGHTGWAGPHAPCHPATDSQRVANNIDQQVGTESKDAFSPGNATLYNMTRQGGV